MSEKEYRSCVEQTFQAFREYDQFVDVVSCWDHLLSEKYSSDGAFHFDRFPVMDDSQGAELRPSFAARFNPDYGILFDVNKRLPQVEDRFEDKLNEIEKYDSHYTFGNGDGSGIEPRVFDIALLVHGDHFQTETLRIDNAISSGKLNIESNLILMSYTYMDQETNPKYRFQRAAMAADNFRDESLPEDLRFSRRMSMDGGSFESLDIPADAFFDRKATGVLFNQHPPNLYLACYLWDTVFYDLLEDDQKIIWTRGDPAKILDIIVNVNELTTRLNRDYIPEGGVSEEWVNDALEYMCVAETAKKLIEDSRFYVKFRNLREKRRKYKDVIGTRSQHSDLAQLFAEWHCENAVELEEDDLDSLKSADPANAPDSLREDLTQPELGEF